MTIGDFDTYYGDHPWAGIDKNQRTWYDPDLAGMFRQKSVYTPLISYVKNNGAVNAKTMVVNQMLDPHGDFSTLALRQLWMPAAHIDSRQVEVTFNRYGGKVAYHEYDEIISYWKKNNKSGLRRIMTGALGTHMVDVFDALARNAYLNAARTGGFEMYSGGATSFNDIATDDLFDPATSEDIWLGMSYRDIPQALGPDGAEGFIVCVTSPGVINSIQGNQTFQGVMDYADPTRRLRYEVGTYKNVRYIQTPKATLWNCGAIAVRANVTAAITAGDGAADPDSVKVDGAYKVGQSGATHYIQLQSDAFASGAMADFNDGDIVTIHTTTTAANGVTGGVDFNEGMAHYRRIVDTDDANFRLVFDKPIMVDMATDLGGGVYAYVTKGRHIHASTFISSPNGIVTGVGRPPRVKALDPVDDFGSMHRFSWNGYFGHNTYAPETFETVFSAGKVRLKGAAVVQ